MEVIFWKYYILLIKICKSARRCILVLEKVQKLLPTFQWETLSQEFRVAAQSWLSTFDFWQLGPSKFELSAQKWARISPPARKLKAHQISQKIITRSCKVLDGNLIFAVKRWTTTSKLRKFSAKIYYRAQFCFCCWKVRTVAVTFILIKIINLGI